MVDLDKFLVDKKYIARVHNNNVYNKKIIDYYRRYREEGNKMTLTKIEKLCSCNQFWVMEEYQANGIRDFIYTSLCHDKFCSNCKKVKQATRMSKYIPELEKYKDNLYHLTLTIPNVNGKKLKKTIKHMSDCFKSLIRYINGNKKLSFIDFSKYGYEGAIRSLEVTFNEDSYHPHYHCAFIFNNLNLDKTIKNVYSIDFKGNREDRLFSEFEIIIQKIWYLLINDIDVTYKNYKRLDKGYSCICDRFYDNDYMELFKYMTKDMTEDSQILTYENFKVLYEALDRVKQLQGYGALYKVDDKDLAEEVDKIYCDIKEFLRTEEYPVTFADNPFYFLNDNQFKIISRKTIFQTLKNLE